MRDHHLALGNTAGAQIARLEEQRLEEQLNLLLEQKKHLVLLSPVDGIVLSGDLKRALGSPVSKGQSLFEVSPLEEMIVELAVRENHITYLQPDMDVRVRFDAYPDGVWVGSIKKINPKSEIRENRNVFIAELEFNNPDGRLRPGMQGKAVIHTGSRPLGWIVFHKPWYTLLQLKDFLF
jgi:multidrug efflux pump subunit AcrA (membrane-fusion protein)